MYSELDIANILESIYQMRYVSQTLVLIDETVNRDILELILKNMDFPLNNKLFIDNADEQNLIMCEGYSENDIILVFTNKKTFITALVNSDKIECPYILFSM